MVDGVTASRPLKWVKKNITPTYQQKKRLMAACLYVGVRAFLGSTLTNSGNKIPAKEGEPDWRMRDSSPSPRFFIPEISRKVIFNKPKS